MTGVGVGVEVEVEAAEAAGSGPFNGCPDEEKAAQPARRPVVPAHSARARHALLRQARREAARI